MPVVFAAAHGRGRGGGQGNLIPSKASALRKNKYNESQKKYFKIIGRIKDRAKDNPEDPLYQIVNDNIAELINGADLLEFKNNDHLKE